MSDLKNKIDFKCKNCGACCKIDGYVHVDKAEMILLADYLELSLGEFKRKCVRYIKGEGNVLKDSPYASCMFLNEKGCTVYSARPYQCRSFPYWDEFEDEAELKEAMEYCKGIKLKKG